MKSFDEIFVDKTKYGVKIQTTEYGEVGEHIIIDQGQCRIAGYTDREEGLFEEVPVIIFGDHTRVIKYVDEPFFLGADGVKVLRSKDDNANYKYLYYALKNARILDTGYNRHFKWLKEVQINYPDSDKQAEIVEILDKVSNVIKKREDELYSLDDLIKARFVEMFGDPIVNEKRWAVVELNSVCDGIGDGLHGTPEYDEKGKYPFINGNNLMNGAIEITSATKMVDEATYKRHFIELSNNAILLSINGTLGKLAFYNGEEVMLGKSACYCNLKPCINRDFVYGVMKTDAFTGFLESNSTASTIKNVGLKAIRGFMLIMPPEELQTRYVEFAKQVDKSKVAVQKTLEETQVLFDSLMQQYFG